MKKIVVHKAGGYERLVLEEHPDLTSEPGKIVIAVEAAGVNYADCCVRWIAYDATHITTTHHNHPVTLEALLK